MDLDKEIADLKRRVAVLEANAGVDARQPFISGVTDDNRDEIYAPLPDSEEAAAGGQQGDPKPAPATNKPKTTGKPTPDAPAPQGGGSQEKPAKDPKPKDAQA